MLGKAIAMRIATLTFAAAAVALSAASAQGQSPGQGAAGVTGGDFGGAHRRHSSTKKADAPNQKADEKGYKAVLDQLPDKKYDAWHGVR